MNKEFSFIFSPVKCECGLSESARTGTEGRAVFEQMHSCTLKTTACTLKTTACLCFTLFSSPEDPPDTLRRTMSSEGSAGATNIPGMAFPHWMDRVGAGQSVCHYG